MRAVSVRIGLGSIALLSSACIAAAPTSMPSTDFSAILASHPAAEALTTFFEEHRSTVAPSTSTRADYLPLIAGNVGYWKHFQDDRGAIVDPYEKLERQYSTPAFALAAATLVAYAGRADLLVAATRAMDWSLWCLANKQTADKHADFYIPMVMHAYRLLRNRVPPTHVAWWDEQLRSLNAETTYRSTRAAGNWNLVHVSGEWLRRKDGLVAAGQMEPQRKYLERCIAAQLKSFTPAGMYVDLNAPLAYDAFPRLWLEDLLADGAYDDGEHRGTLEETLTRGGLSTLLLLSPSGEWPSGGRSAHHQWNEAQIAVIGEINAVRWQRAGRADIAGAFKRAAHLARQSMNRWQRGTGEFWIVKNFADPGRRFGFMGYSFNTQYNLLAVAMLSIAYERADDSIAQTPLPSEVGSYVFDLRDSFHHVAAAAGGYYVWIDTAADPDHGSTGLQQVHRAGVDLSPLTDTPAPKAGMGPADEKSREAMSPGIEWKEGDRWRSIASFGTRRAPSTRATTRAAAADDRSVTSATLKVESRSKDRVEFNIQYVITGDHVTRDVEESYAISADGVEGSSTLASDGSTRLVFPALVNDGARDTRVDIDRSTLAIARLGAPLLAPAASKETTAKPGGTLVWEVLSPAGLSLARVGPQIVTHNGYVQAVAAELPAGSASVRWRLTLEPNPTK